jgi:hypothetical protein
VRVQKIQQTPKQQLVEAVAEAYAAVGRACECRKLMRGRLDFEDALRVDMTIGNLTLLYESGIGIESLDA